ncbi:MAG: hypothetical protein HZC47_01930 [Methanobacterium sp.]|uniref:hypothetical protein n=1 Tax=Methanobacterium sp. TaxID=2164 RepID=UPI003D64C6D4|nr:hypothetical protein [Methanobacterium sp.]
MANNFLNKRWFAWDPSSDTVIALITALIMIGGGYYLMVHLPEGSVIKTVYEFILTFLLVVFPVWWLLWHENGSLKDLGIKKEGIVPSLIISILIAAYFLYYALSTYSFYGTNLIPHFLTNALILWEPFFIFCWLQLRFDKAFGIIPGILLAGISLGAYHIGTYPMAEVVVLALFGILFAAIFRITSNLLIMWPLTWSTSSAVGTLKGGFLLGWNDVIMTSILLLAQIAVIIYTWKKIEKKSK